MNSGASPPSSVASPGFASPQASLGHQECTPRPSNTKRRGGPLGRKRKGAKKRRVKAPTTSSPVAFAPGLTPAVTKSRRAQATKQQRNAKKQVDEAELRRFQRLSNLRNSGEQAALAAATCTHQGVAGGV